MALKDGSSLTSNYPTDASPGPFAVFFAFWIYLVREVQTLKRHQEDALPGARSAGWD